MSDIRSNIRALTAQELDAILDLVEKNNVIILSCIENNRAPKTPKEWEAWGSSASAAALLAETIKQMKSGETND